MGRHKTVSDAEVLAIARQVFREQGHAASTREIAKAAGLSEAVLYQRFRSKDALFFASMVPATPDIEQMLGPVEPRGDARTFVTTSIERMGRYFAEVLPVAMRVMLHPSFDSASLTALPAAAMHRIETELAARLRFLREQGSITNGSPSNVARLITSLAHDWALRCILSGHGSAHSLRSLSEIIDIVWDGLAPREAGARAHRAP